MSDQDTAQRQCYRGSAHEAPYAERTEQRKAGESERLPAELDAPLARLMAQVADALAEYAHLPQPVAVSVNSTTEPMIRSQLGYAPKPERAIVEWASAFCVPVTIKMDVGFAEMQATVPLAGHEMRLQVTVSHSTAELVARVAGVSLQPVAAQVDSAGLLDALAGDREGGAS